jgi:hypothetical protein
LVVAVDITQHRRCDVNGEDVIAEDSRDEVIDLSEDDRTYASVKKPTPATRQTLAWNQLKETVSQSPNLANKIPAYENLALSTSAKAARRRSSRTKVFLGLGPSLGN